MILSEANPEKIVNKSVPKLNNVKKITINGSSILKKYPRRIVPAHSENQPIIPAPYEYDHIFDSDFLV